MIHVEAEVAIDRQADDVFDFIANFENNPIWQGGMVSAEFTSDPPMRVGSTYHQRASFLGRSIVSEFEVTEYQPPFRVSASSVSGSFPITFTRIVASDGSAAKVRAIVEGDPKGLFRIATPILKVMVASSIRRDYRRLKSLLERE